MVSGFRSFRRTFLLDTIVALPVLYSILCLARRWTRRAALSRRSSEQAVPLDVTCRQYNTIPRETLLIGIFGNRHGVTALRG